MDLNPLDVTDENDTRCLRALVLPDHQQRHERLAAALELAVDHPPELAAGDAAEALPARLGAVPTDATLVVFGTIAHYQFPDDGVAAVRGVLSDASHGRPIHWLPGDPATPPSDPAYRHVRFEDGGAETGEITASGAYGGWLSWRGRRGIKKALWRRYSRSRLAIKPSRSSRNSSTATSERTGSKKPSTSMFSATCSGIDREVM